MEQETKKENTIYTIKLEVATLVNGKILKCDTRPYLGENKNKINSNITKKEIETPVYPDVQTIKFAKERWERPLEIKGIRELQRHLDIIFEAVYNGSVIVTAITIDATNTDWS